MSRMMLGIKNPRTTNGRFPKFNGPVLRHNRRKLHSVSFDKMSIQVIPGPLFARNSPGTAPLRSDHIPYDGEYVMHSESLPSRKGTVTLTRILMPTEVFSLSTGILDDVVYGPPTITNHHARQYHCSRWSLGDRRYSSNCSLRDYELFLGTVSRRRYEVASLSLPTIVIVNGCASCKFGSPR